MQFRPRKLAYNLPSVYDILRARWKEKMIKAFKMRLEYGMGPEYERRRAETWPEVEQMIVFHVD